MNRFLFFFLLMLLAGSLQAYEIKGKLKISDDWQPRIYLASINAPENLFVASPEFIINEAIIDSEGRFDLSGQDLPEDPRFYRLYLVRNNLFVVEFTIDSVRNFMHLILDNNSSVTIENSVSGAVFDPVTINGSDRNTVLNDFENTYFRKRKLLNDINTTAKRDFQSQSLNKYIRNFVETCADPLIGLFAVYHIEDKETDFLRNSNFYFKFQEKVEASYSKSIYTSAYDDLVKNLVGYRDLVCEIPKITKPWRDWIIAGEALIILVLSFLLIIQKRHKKEKQPEIDFKLLLTDKERQIWESLAAGKTNKEIAADLYIELSTVKTHINNLYKRLGVSNRKEAILLYNRHKI